MDTNSTVTATANAPRTVRAVYNFRGDNNDELCFKKGDLIVLTQYPTGGWWEGTLDGVTGWFPCNYVEDVDGVRGEQCPPIAVSDASAMNEDTSQEYRNFVFNEIISSESQYTKELHETLQLYLLPLQKLNLLPEEELAIVVSRFRDVLTHHLKLLSSLEELRCLSNKERRIGGVFMQLASTLKDVHVQYCSIHVKFVHLIEKKKEEISVFMKEVLNSKDLNKGSVILTSNLSNCFRRLDKYPAVLQELQRYTDEAHPDRGDTQRAVFVYRDIVASCLQMRRQKEMELEVMLGNVKNWPESEEPISTLGSAVNMGPVTVLQSPEGSKEVKKDRYLVLFPGNLLILYVSNEMTSFVFEKKLFLNEITLPRLPEQQSTKDNFEILVTAEEFSMGTAKYIFQCQTIEEVKNWIKLMHQCKSQNKVDSKSLKERRKVKERDFVKSGISSFSSGSLSSMNKSLPANAKRSKYWESKSMLPHPPIRSSRNDVAENDATGSKHMLSPNSKQNEDMAILKVIEAYYLSGRVRKQAVSNVFESPQVLLKDEEKIMVENSKANCTEIEERTLVDCIYALQDEVKQMKAEINYLADCLKSERKSRRKLKAVVEKLCAHLDNI